MIEVSIEADAWTSALPDAEAVVERACARALDAVPTADDGDGAAVVAAPLSAPSGAASAVPAPPLPSASAAPGPATAAPGPATASPETPRAKHQPPAPAPAPPAAPVPALSQLAVSPDHRAVLEAAAAAIPGAAAADVTTIAAFLEGLDDSFFGDDLDALGGA